jgi:hypothetical protein
MSELDLIYKLATNWHLSVLERELLPHRKAKASLVCNAITRILHNGGWYPQDWRPQLGFDGGVIELLSDDRCRIHWQAEVGVCRFASVGVQECRDPSEAATAWLRKMFPTDIDGVLIDWTDAADTSNCGGVL